MTAVSATAAFLAHWLGASPSPTRAVTKATRRAAPRCVSDMPASALAASAAVTPGTTSCGTPAARSAVISSCARPKSIGSPPFRRTTTRCLRAASTRRLLMKCCAVTNLPQRLPTATFSASAASSSSAPGTSASWNTTSALRSISAPRTVMRSAAPGPAPTMNTLPGVRFMESRSRAPLAAAEQRLRTLDRRLVRFAEDGEAGQRVLRVLSVAQDERIEAAARQEEQLVAENVAGRPQLALPAVALAQQAPRGKAAAIAELGEIHRHDGEVREVSGDRAGLIAALQPDSQPPLTAQERVAPLLPQRKRHDQVTRGQLRGKLAVGAGLKPLPG